MAKAKPNTIEVYAKPGESDERTMARKVLQPSVHAVLTVQQLNKTTFGERGMTELVSELKDQMKAVTDGDLSSGEGMLAGSFTLVSVTPRAQVSRRIRRRLSGGFEWQRSRAMPALNTALASRTIMALVSRRTTLKRTSGSISRGQIARAMGGRNALSSPGK